VTTAAFFNDGRSAAKVAVEVALHQGAVEIRDPADGLLLARWLFAELVVLDDPGAGRLRLSCASDEDARLSLADATLTEQLRLVAPALAKRRGRVPRMVKLAALVLAAPLAAVVIYQGLLWGVRPLAHLVPFAWETRLAGGLAPSLAKQQGGTCDRASGQMVLDSLSQRLIAAGEIPYPISVRVVRSPIVNALALPGGQVLVFDGLLKDAQSPDEVAAVLAHEFSHVALRHITENTLRHAGIGVVVMLLTGEPSGATAGLVSGMVSLSFSRQAEAEADANGLQLLRKAGISAQGMGSFFRRLQNRETTNGSLPVFLSDHPSSASRAAIAGNDQNLPPSLSSTEWQALQSICN
jgi:Zn-dependent protease with chaperone function